MARLPETFIDELLSRVDVVEVIQERLSLKRQGKEYGAPCPFHDERTPSFTVSPAKQFYHCFGCGAHGSAITFLMEYDRLEFLDAVEELAARAGVQMPRDEAVREARAARAPLYEALAAAADFYSHQLEHSSQARAYLAGRGVAAQSIERFQVGYAPAGFTQGMEHFQKAGLTSQALERAGLVSRNERGQAYDRFRNRIMFPIHDRRGRVIGFGGRALEESGGPKYLNSPETELFHKGHELYGLWHARQAPAEQRLVVAEGYLDVIALAQAGHGRVVATLGTATTAEHAQTLFRDAADVVFCFDGDKAGQAAAVRALEATLPCMRDGRQGWFMALPSGQDPDSIVRDGGLQAFSTLLNRAEAASAFCFRHLSEGVNLGTIDGKARLAERARPLLAMIPEGAFADLMDGKLSELTGLSRRAARRQPALRRSPAVAATRPSLVRTTIGLLLQRPTLGAAVASPYRFVQLRQPGVELLVEILTAVRHEPEISVRALLARFDGRPEQSALRRLAAAPSVVEDEHLQGEFDDAIIQLNRNATRQRIADLKAKQVEAALAPEEKQELLELLRERVGPQPVG